jgi:lysyl-tRNA synthetase class 1
MKEQTKPLSPHWADIAALKVIKERGDKDSYVVASGITPSGTVHIGNFREVLTVDLVARALNSLHKKVHFIYSWDNFDTFRKVPKNLPDPEAFKPYLREAIARIPDPWGEEKSYAHGRIAAFEHELKRVGIAPHFIYQESEYGRGRYANEIRFALENKDKIRSILDKFRKEPLAENWLPTSIYCGKCHKDSIEKEEYRGDWNYYYKCQHCHNEETVDIRKTANLKLAWRVDWPMRWHVEKVDFEPGGKDHSSDGGSHDTGKLIIDEIWNEKAPSYLQYDFVMIKGGAGKMSSSSGELYTLSQVLDVYEPTVVRWIFASQRPNHDFAIAFDEDVIKCYDEFDKSEQIAFSPPDMSDKWPLMRRIVELSYLDTKFPEQTPKRPKFRPLCNHLQLCGGDIDRTFERYYAKEYSKVDKPYFMERAVRAKFWLNNYAPEEFRYTLRLKKEPLDLSPQETKVIEALRQLLHKIDLDSIEEKVLNNMIWENVIKATDSDSKEAFQTIYRVLLNRDQGPRLPSFLKEIGKESLLELL